jgi:segregation and condensation protein A
MREAGARLLARDRLGRDVFARGAPEGLRVIRKAAWQAELYDLIAAYGSSGRGASRRSTSSAGGR